MKREGFLQTAFMLTAALLLLAACTQDELADKQGEPLPEGKYPLTFTASIGGETVAATPQTRASADGDATSLDYIGTWVLNDQTNKQRTMIFKRDGATSTWKYDENIANDDQPTTPYYWGSTSESIKMGAWYFPANKEGEAYKNNVIYPNTGYSEFYWEVVTDQSKDNGYENSDFLYASEMLEFSGSKTLHFFHQTAKVVVHIIAGDQTPADISGDKIGMTIGTTDSEVSVSGRWTAPQHWWTDDSSWIFGTWDSGNSTRGIINPKALGQQDITVNGKEKQSLASYEALVIPQTVQIGANFIAIKVGDTNYYYKAESGNNRLLAGHVYTYNITVKGEELEVTVNNSIEWADGGTGSGSVRPTKCDQLGSGTAADPYLLTNVTQLQDFAANGDLFKHYKLTTNITLPPVEGSGSNWTPRLFFGTFDGNECTITGLTVLSPGSDYIGLFGQIDGAGTVKNLTLAACKIGGRYSVGGIAGENYGTIENCHIIDGSVTGSGSFVGGITGRSSGHIIACSNTATVTSTGSFVGGITGRSSGHIIACSNTATVTGTGNFVGGITGDTGFDEHNSPVTIISCYNAGSVAGSSHVGAITGSIDEPATLTSCYYANDPGNGYGTIIIDQGRAIDDMNAALGTNPYEWVVDQTTGQPVVRSK